MWQFFETGTFYLHIKKAESSSQQPDSSRRVQATRVLVYGMIFMRCDRASV